MLENSGLNVDIMVEDKKQYQAESIKVLEGLEGVRRRPAMYIGSTGKDGLHHLVYEVVDNSVDESMAGYCTEIIITINKDGSITVIDNGRGIPVDIHPVYKTSAMEIALTKLHAGGKFEKDVYQISGGLHGVGVSVVNALSKKLIAKVKRDENIYQQEYSIGKPLYSVKIIGKCGKETGTEITFFPDPDIFSTLDFDFVVLRKRLQEIAFLNPIKIILRDEKQNKEETLNYKGGLSEFIEHINKSKSALHKPIYFKKESNGNIVEVAIQYIDGYNENIFGFVNTINTTEGGTHISGFKTALTRVINDYITKKNLLKGEKIMGDDTREGLTAVVNIKMREPQFEGQTKTKLGNSEMKGIVDSMVYVILSEIFEENPTVANKVALKVVTSAKARSAAKKARDLVRRKNIIGFSGLPGKLADCSSRKFEKTELYVVEGDSAGGCFSGDTEVALSDGRAISFKQLIEENNKGIEHFCYTIKNDGTIGIGKIKHPRITKCNAEVIKIILDNNEEIICTPDHYFMLRDGNYKKAKNLTIDHSLMPLNRKISKIGGKITIDGYEMVWDNIQEKWIFTHLLADDYNLKQKIYEKSQGDTRHHIDFNKLNNNPTNIIRIPKVEHLSLHTEQLNKTLHRKDVKEKSANTRKTLEYKDKIRSWSEKPEVKKMLSERAKKLWRNPQYKAYMMERYMEFYNTNEEYKKNNKKRLYEAQKKYWSNIDNRKKAAEKIKKFFRENPDAKEYLSIIAKEQWQNNNLLIWRKEKTREQWTPEFRKKRKQSYDVTYYNKTLHFMKKVYENYGSLNNFDDLRIKNNDKNVLSMRTFCSRFFKNNNNEMIDAVLNYNHKIKRIIKLNEKIDVYDLEVEDTHNFALASGIFVHNSAKLARDKEYQAILPLKGKVLNVEKSSPTKALSSDEILNLITAVGTGVKESFDITKLRYNKVIILSDADVDGQHITTLLLTFFFRYMHQLIENGNVFVALPPLYRIRKGKDYYVYTDEELKKALEKLGKADVTRFKGLSEMNPEQLWETTMDPKKRILKKVTIEDAVLADETFSMLMGDIVGPRRKFIEVNANIAEVDI